MNEKTIYALGFFDGVHLGHGALLTACRHMAQGYGCRAGVVTFENHPDALVLGKAPGLIQTPASRERLLRQQYGMETVISLPFNREMMTMPWENFFRLLKNTYHAAGIVCGHDFRFGDRGLGTPALLQSACREGGIPCVVIPPQKLGGLVISSTHIRSLLEKGNVAEAAKFLGHPYTMTGTVVPGLQLGRTLGIPTANLHLPAGVLAPRFGVYGTVAHVKGGTYPAVTNIGIRPTVQGRYVTVETWLLDFDGDLYGQALTLDFYSFLRPEEPFPNVQALAAQIRRDAETVRKAL